MTRSITYVGRLSDIAARVPVTALAGPVPGSCGEQSLSGLMFAGCHASAEACDAVAPFMRMLHVENAFDSPTLSIPYAGVRAACTMCITARRER